jgi:hypothetical protein
MFGSCHLWSTVPAKSQIQSLLYQINMECNVIKKKLEYHTDVNKITILQQLEDIHQQFLDINQQTEALPIERELYSSTNKDVDWYSFVDTFWSSD